MLVHQHGIVFILSLNVNPTILTSEVWKRVLRNLIYDWLCGFGYVFDGIIFFGCHGNFRTQHDGGSNLAFMGAIVTAPRYQLFKLSASVWPLDLLYFFFCCFSRVAGVFL